MKPFDIAIIGAGSFGTAIAIHLAQQEHNILLWGRNPEHVEQMASLRQNARYLPGIVFPPSLALTHDLNHAVEVSEHIVLAVPSHAFGDMVAKLPFSLTKLCWLTKGLDPKTNVFLHQIVQQKYPKLSFAILSGPSFAKEVAQGLPTALTLAGNDSDYIHSLHRYFHGDNFRVYLSNDYVGVQLAGAVKNVLAIAVGVSDGLGFGANTRAALITRGLSEMQRLGLCFGALEKTFIGLTGLGDLLLTATDNQSRNRRFGLELGQGKSPQEAAQAVSQVIEGRDNAIQVCALGQAKKVTLPICTTVNAIIQQQLTARKAVATLLKRPATYE